MILASFDNAQEDFRKRQTIEAQVEADNILLALEKGRNNPAWQQLDEHEKSIVPRRGAGRPRRIHGAGAERA